MSVYVHHFIIRLKYIKCIKAIFIHRTLEVQSNLFQCPKKMVHEFQPLELFHNGSVRVKDKNGERILDSYQCLDLVEIDVDVLDGVSVIVCDTEGLLNKGLYYYEPLIK